MYIYIFFFLFSGKDVLKRWKHLRDAFVKSQKKCKASKASGSQASKVKKYIFNDELQFLRKIYEERETEESYNNEERNIEELSGPPSSPEVTTVEGKAEAVVPKAKGLKRQHKKMDDVDLKILEALKKDSEKENDKLTFFKSLLPHVDKFDDNQWLQCQMEFLQVISKIKNTYISTPHLLHTPSTSQIQQLHQPANVNFTQPFNVQQMSQQALTGNIHSQQFTPLPANRMTCSPVTHFQSFSNLPQQKSYDTQHFQSKSSMIMDDNVQSPSPSVASSTNTIDFTEF